MFQPSDLCNISATLSACSGLSGQVLGFQSWGCECPVLPKLLHSAQSTDGKWNLVWEGSGTHGIDAFQHVRGKALKTFQVQINLFHFRNYESISSVIVLHTSLVLNNVWFMSLFCSVLSFVFYVVTDCCMTFTVLYLVSNLEIQHDLVILGLCSFQRS